VRKRLWENSGSSREIVTDEVEVMTAGREGNTRVELVIAFCLPSGCFVTARAFGVGDHGTAAQRMLSMLHGQIMYAVPTGIVAMT
jgi:hypothetical protein